MRAVNHSVSLLLKPPPSIFILLFLLTPELRADRCGGAMEVGGVFTMRRGSASFRGPIDTLLFLPFKGWNEREENVRRRRSDFTWSLAGLGLTSGSKERDTKTRKEKRRTREEELTLSTQHFYYFKMWDLLQEEDLCFHFFSPYVGFSHDVLGLLG